FIAEFPVVAEGDGSVGDAVQDGDDGSGGEGGVEIVRIHLLGRIGGDGSAADVEKSRRARHAVGLDNGQPVLPHGAVDFGGLAPGLGGHVEDKGGVAFSGEDLDGLEAIGGVGSGDVTV